MHDSAPAAVTDDVLFEAARTYWGLDIDRLEYLPIGGGGFHWRATGPGGEWFLTVDDLTTKDWLGDTPDATYEGLGACIGAAVELSRHHPFVGAPIDPPGGAVRRLDELHSLTVSPFLHATAGRWGPIDEADVRGRVIDMVATLHGQHVSAAIPTIPRPVIGVRHWLDEFIDDPTTHQGDGPFGEPARQVLTACLDELAALLHDFDRRSAAVEAPLVVTHGEPHGGNVLSTGDRSWLIDWDTVAHAPAERDLWFLVLDEDDARQYERLTGIAPDRELLDLYRARWAWDDLAHVVERLMSPHDGSDADRHHLDALPHHLAALLPRT